MFFWRLLSFLWRAGVILAGAFGLLVLSVVLSGLFPVHFFIEFSIDLSTLGTSKILVFAWKVLLKSMFHGNRF